MSNDAPPNTDSDTEAALVFVKLAGALADLTQRLEVSRKNGEHVDVMAAFQEATDLIKYPKDDDLNAEIIDTDA